MAFTKQHYVAIAKTISEATRTEPQLHLDGSFYVDKAQLVSELSELFRQDNTRFDENRFIDACYPKS